MRAREQHVVRRVELAVAGAVRAELVGKGAVGVEYLDAVVSGVGDGDHLVVHVGEVSHMDAGRRVELAVAGAARAELEGEGAVRVEDLDAVVSGVGDEDGAGCESSADFTTPNVHRGRRVELAVGVARLRGLGMGIDRRHCRQEGRQRDGGSKYNRQAGARPAGSSAAAAAAAAAMPWHGAALMPPGARARGRRLRPAGMRAQILGTAIPEPLCVVVVAATAAAAPPPSMLTAAAASPRPRRNCNRLLAMAAGSTPHGSAS